MNQKQSTAANIPLAERLAQLMPDIRPAMRRKQFHSYIAHEIHRLTIVGPKPSDADTERMVRANEERFREDGVGPEQFANLPEWRKAVLHQKRAAAGQRGGRQKQANREGAQKAKTRKRTKPELIFVEDANALEALAHPKAKHSPRTLLE